MVYSVNDERTNKVYTFFSRRSHISYHIALYPKLQEIIGIKEQRGKTKRGKDLFFKNRIVTDDIDLITLHQIRKYLSKCLLTCLVSKKRKHIYRAFKF